MFWTKVVGTQNETITEIKDDKENDDNKVKENEPKFNNIDLKVTHSSMMDVFERNDEEHVEMMNNDELQIKLNEIVQSEQQNDVIDISAQLNEDPNKDDDFDLNEQNDSYLLDVMDELKNRDNDDNDDNKSDGNNNNDNHDDDDDDDWLIPHLQQSVIHDHPTNNNHNHKIIKFRNKKEIHEKEDVKQLKMKMNIKIIWIIKD